MLSLRCCLIFLVWWALPAAAGERYIIDSDHTFSSFEYSHWGLSLQRGRFDRNTGFVELDLPARSGSISLSIDSKSVSTGSEMFNGIMRSDNFFDAELYPKITFNSTKFVFEQEKLTRIEGLLTIKDISKAVTVDVTQFSCRFMLLYVKQACGANGNTKILRSDYKMGRYLPFVSDEITLYFSVEGIRE